MTKVKYDLIVCLPFPSLTGSVLSALDLSPIIKVVRSSSRTVK